jgi:hypothetical protein
METSEQQFIKGFNHGYFLTKYLPQLLSKLIISIPNSNDYFQGIHLGKREFENEVTHDHLNDLTQLRNDKNRGLNKEQER